MTLRSGIAGFAGLFLLTVLSVACGGGSPHPSPTGVSPAASPPTASGQPVSFRFVYREFGPEKDTIWEVSPEKPSERIRLAEIAHRSGWGVIPSLSPDGKRLAYLSMPLRAYDPSQQAAAYLLDIPSGQTSLLSDHVDLHQPPLWTPDGEKLYLRRNTEEEIILLEVDPAKPESDPARTAVVLQSKNASTYTLIPVGFAEDRQSLYLAEVLASGGTDLVRLKPGEEESRFVIHLSSDQIARDYHLSPDGRMLAFLAAETVSNRRMYIPLVADLSTQTIATLATPDPTGANFLNPLWRPDGEQIAVGREATSGKPGHIALFSLRGEAPDTLGQPEDGFDLPESWAPDGSYLVVTWMEGMPASDPGKTSLIAISSEGARVGIADGPDAIPLGWRKQ